MPRLPPRYNYGSELKNENPTLYNQLTDIYTDTANIVNTKTGKYATNVDPQASAPINGIFDIGDIWVKTTTDTAWILTSRLSATSVTWKQIT